MTSGQKLEEGTVLEGREAGEGATREDPRQRRSRGSSRGVLIALVALLIVAAVVAGGILPRLKARAALRTETNELAVPAVFTMQPKRGAPQQEIVLPANVQAFTDAPIYARTNGYLKAWFADIGAHVKAGQLLAEIDTPELDQQLQQAQADLNTAQANYKLAEITAARYQGLMSSDSVSKQDVDNATSDFSAKQAMVQSAEHNVKRLEEVQSFQKIYAPFDGVITTRNTDVGALIDSGAAGGTTKELFHIAATKRLRVYVSVPQQYSQVARPGLTADLTLAEFPGRKFKGTLVRTANAIDTSTRTLLVEVDVENPIGELLPGAYAEVHLKLPTETPTFILPVNTLIFRGQGMQIATVQDGNKAVLVPILIGRDFGNEVEVISGLSGEEKVIVNPPDSIIAGEKVRVSQSAHAGAAQ